MASRPILESEFDTQLIVGKRILAARLRKGWNQSELAAKSGVSRTTLYQLERGVIPSPRAATLHRLATALEIPITHLNADAAGAPELARPDVPPAEPRTDRDFDRQTNPFVEVVSQQFPNVFQDFTPDDWDELYSSFGTGGALTETGVLRMAEGIARKRETLRRVSILLETHLGDAAAAMIDSLFALVDLTPPANADRSV